MPKLVYETVDYEPKITKNLTQKNLCEDDSIPRCHLNCRRLFFSYISDLSNNRVHDKVCSPNFYCFKFIIINASAHFKIHHCLFAITTSSLEVRKISTFLMS